MDELKVNNVSKQKKKNKNSKKGKTNNQNEARASTLQIENRLTNKVMSLSDRKILEAMQVDTLSLAVKTSTPSTSHEVSRTLTTSESGNSIQIIKNEIKCLIDDAAVCVDALISTIDKFDALNKVFT